MQKLLLLLIIPFLSFGQCEDESACNYGLVSEDFLDGAFSAECEYVGDYCFIQDVFFPWGPNCSGSLGLFHWDESCECVAMEYEGCSPSDNTWVNGCPFIPSSLNPGIIPIAFPDSIVEQCGILGMPGSLPLVCLEPGDSCLFGLHNNPAIESAGFIAPIPDIINHSDSSTYTFYPVDILESSLNNFPYDWLVVNYLNSVVNENCECECVTGNYLHPGYPDVGGGMGWTPYTYLDIPLTQFFYDCNPVTSYLEEVSVLKHLITITDILGRESTNKGFQLHIYDDGSVEKKYVIK